MSFKKQKAEGRKKGSPAKEKREMVNNTVAHIQNKEAKTYTLNTSTVSQMMTIVLAFLLSNGLLSKSGSLVFFTDGARDLRSAIQGIFHFISFKIILSWFHLEKKCKDLLSMAIKGKEVKNQTLTEVLAWLWLGKVERAIKVLSDLKIERFFGRVFLFFHLQRPPLSGWSEIASQVALTYAASVIVGLAAQQAGRPDLIRSPKRVLAHL
jgi:hypothetical protein